MTLTRRTLATSLAACSCCSGLLRFSSAAHAQTPPPSAAATNTSPSTAVGARARGGCTVVAADAKAVLARRVSSASLQPQERRFAAVAASQTPNLAEKGAGGSSGGNAIANSLVKAIQRLSTTFAVQPPFEFYDEPKGENAQALEPTAEFPGGAVIFDRRFFARLMQHDPSGVAVLGALAHEFGHIAMFQRPKLYAEWSRRPTVMRIELHADYLAGYYLGLRKRELPDISLFKAGMIIWNLGDNMFTEADHHGGPADRTRAAEAGFLLGLSVAPSFQQAFDYATNFVSVSYEFDPR